MAIFFNELCMHFSYIPSLPHGQPQHFQCFDDNYRLLKKRESYSVISRLCGDRATLRDMSRSDLKDRAVDLSNWACPRENSSLQLIRIIHSYHHYLQNIWYGILKQIKWIYFLTICSVMSVAKLAYEYQQARDEKTPDARSPGDWIMYSGA